MKSEFVKLSDERLRKPYPREGLEKLSRQELLVILDNEHRLRIFLEEHVLKLEEKVFEFKGKFFRVRSKIFDPSTEKSSPGKRRNSKKKTSSSPKSPTTKLPSERYPNAEIIEKHITCEEDPECGCCGHAMQDSGMTETSEYLTVIPKKYLIVRQHRHKYRCEKCHGDIVTTPAIPRVIPGSSYSDELVVDATLSKYCDLIPMERYSQMAKRQGFPGLPPHSLIGATFKLAEFLKGVYKRIRAETLNTKVLLADETPHRMLEGDDRTGWYLWGFLSGVSCFYECHDTRSGDIASAVLRDSNCEVLLTDVYAGYGKALKETNKLRVSKGLLPIEAAFCNSHARRGFVKNEFDGPVETQIMIREYKEIYKLEASTANQPAEEVQRIRDKMKSIFIGMKKHAESMIDRFSSKSGIAQAFGYFLKNYDGLTLFLKNPLVPIDNNPAERMLRSPVVGRKTWYGTHSKDGAMAAAIHFSIVESCKLSGVNPRSYYAEIIKKILANEPVMTPKGLQAHTKAQLAAIESS